MARVALRAEVTGVVFSIGVTVGSTVRKGDSVMFLESMKMEIPVVATADGAIVEILVAIGETVEENAPVATLETVK